ncbi:MAG: fructose-1,6-bisphosphatase [Ruminococcaceae bacterium]|nr:fructose-1,6-bisphosphatase [Oscillospiraceae bacterium]
MTNRQYLELLAKEYPNASAVSAEIINLSAICQLPKGTEYFFSDIHGEADAFAYQLGTASGMIRARIEQLFQNALPEPERLMLGTLIYRPTEVLADRQQNCDDDDDWCRVTIFRLVQVCKSAASKYTRSKVRKKMPARFAYVLDELLHANTEENKEDYYTAIINAIIDTGKADKFIIALCRLIRHCSIDQLHILGDIFDRGPHADLVFEELATFGDVDIQWGNHDIHWMGAAAGHPVCVANAVRLAISYNNFDLLEDSYGINLRPLSTFASEVYHDDPCFPFRPKVLDENVYDPIDEDLAAKMHKAIAIIQFKLEGQLYERHPEFGMDARNLLKRINLEEGLLESGGTFYPMRDTCFPTLDTQNPLALTPAENDLIQTLAYSFTRSATLNRHIRYLYNHGSIYKIANGNLLYHGCIPMEEDGSFTKVPVGGKTYSGRAYLDKVDALLRTAYFGPEDAPERMDAGDVIWYLWCGRNSPVFGKNHMTTFERYFVEDKTAHKEHDNPYYRHVNERETCERILEEFGLDPHSGHIINGHVPVRLTEGESPIKGGGRLFVIDGGLSKAYHKRTGIGGYTLIFNSHNLALAQHRPFQEVRDSGFSITPQVEVVERFPRRLMVRDTDIGRRLQQDIVELKKLLAAYRDGTIQEKSN